MELLENGGANATFPISNITCDATTGIWTIPGHLHLLSGALWDLKSDIFYVNSFSSDSVFLFLDFFIFIFKNKKKKYIFLL